MCDFLSGRCVPPEARCVLTGTAAVCAGGGVPRATVKADGLCGLTVTFELRKDLELYVSAYTASSTASRPRPVRSGCSA